MAMASFVSRFEVRDGKGRREVPPHDTGGERPAAPSFGL